VTGSDESGWDHMVSMFPSPFSCFLQVTLSPAKHLFLIKWGWLLSSCLECERPSSA
jgi:hypothetical protein